MKDERKDDLKNKRMGAKGGKDGKERQGPRGCGVGQRKKTRPLALEQQGALEQSLTAAYFPT